MKPAVELRGKNVLVVGLARTGVATALFCAARGARLRATDARPASEFAEAAGRLSAAGVVIESGGHRRESFLSADLIVPSPGVSYDQPDLVAARRNGVAVWSEIELAWRFLRGRLVAITGSNGKTTTTALTGHILKTAGLPVQVGGNIGTPLISLVDGSRDDSICVVEVSSFQLEAVVAFRPDISVFLNLTPDHIDRHGSLESYAAAKARIFENQKREDAAVMNADDPASLRYAPSRPRLFWFSRKREVAQGAFLRGDDIYFCHGDAEARLLSRQEISLRGQHNLENVLAAVTAASLAGAAPAAIAEGVRTFPGVEHRLQFVASVGGVDFYNDSKATNVDATEKALEAFPGNLLVILGGKDKGSPYTPLRPLLAARARRAFLIGAAAEKIAGQIEGAVPLEMCGTLDAAVRAACAAARPGDVVLLAPACASFDQFENFEHRGRVFVELVRRLAAESQAAAPQGAAGGKR
jgi:UDP-N-acetylmuramoylalanine--D-glutamate ligase